MGENYQIHRIFLGQPCLAQENMHCEILGQTDCNIDIAHHSKRSELEGYAACLEVMLKLVTIIFGL